MMTLLGSRTALWAGAAGVALLATMALGGCTTGELDPAVEATEPGETSQTGGDPGNPLALGPDGVPLSCPLDPAPAEPDPEVAEWPVEFEVVDEDTAVMTGTIGADFVHRVCDLAREQPAVTEVVLLDVPGQSTPGNETLEAGQVMRALGYTTLVPGDGQVESGGVDLFLAGEQRLIEDGGCLGVHSTEITYGDEVISAADLPRDDPEHQPFLEYFEAMGIDPGFYWFTLSAAPAGGIHYLTPAEIEQWGLVTGPVPTVECPLPNEG